MVVAPPLAINGKFLSAAPTGVHRVAAELANALADIIAEHVDDFDVELWIPRDAVESATTIRLPARRMGWLTGIPWEQLVLPFRRRDRLLLNLCNIGPVTRANAITMIHDAQVHLTPQSYGMPFRLWYKIVQPLLGRRNRQILTVSEYSRQQIASAGICPADRITVIPNGVDHMLRVAPETDIIAQLGLENRRFVVALATIQAHKNISILTEAFAAPELADIPLVLVGADGRDAFAAHGIALAAGVVFAGRISDGALRALFEAALCIAFPSRTEGFGLPPMEAMLLGCPAIVAPCGALPEVCGDAALYADPDRPEEWIHHIRALADDSALHQQYAEAGRIQAQRFTWKAAAERLLRAICEPCTASARRLSRLHRV